MNMKTENEKWADEVLNSFDSIQRAEVSPFLYDKILNKINARVNEYAPQKLIWLTVASFALLILLNWQIIKKNKLNVEHKKTVAKEIAEEYQLLNNDFINYN